MTYLLLRVMCFYFETRNSQAGVLSSILADPHYAKLLVSGVLASGFAQNVLQHRLTQDDTADEGMLDSVHEICEMIRHKLRPIIRHYLIRQSIRTEHVTQLLKSCVLRPPTSSGCQ